MTIRTAAVVHCDGCGAQLLTPHEAAERATVWALQQGWTVRDGLDYCPSCPSGVEPEDAGGASP